MTDILDQVVSELDERGVRASAYRVCDQLFECKLFCDDDREPISGRGTTVFASVQSATRKAKRKWMDRFDPAYEPSSEPVA
jgi:hypothetical protein